MPRMFLTDRSVAGLKPTPGKQIDYFDERMPGFGLRVSPSGHRAWIVLYRVGRRVRRLTLGSYPVLSLADARLKGKLAMSEVIQGADPAAEKRAERRAETFGELARLHGEAREGAEAELAGRPADDRSRALADLAPHEGARDRPDEYGHLAADRLEDPEPRRDRGDGGVRPALVRSREA